MMANSEGGKRDSDLVICLQQVMMCLPPISNVNTVLSKKINTGSNNIYDLIQALVESLTLPRLL
jgi:translation elongation factor EF-1alpha